MPDHVHLFLDCPPVMAPDQIMSRQLSCAPDSIPDNDAPSISFDPAIIAAKPAPLPTDHPYGAGRSHHPDDGRPTRLLRLLLNRCTQTVTRPIAHAFGR